MKYSSFLLAGALAACSSHNTPPAESAAAVQAATDTPTTGANFAPASVDGEASAHADRRSPGTSSSNPMNAGNTMSPSASTPQSNTATASNEGSEGASNRSIPYPNNAAALPAQSPPAANEEADNTRVNRRDRSGTTLTPLDQGSSEADRKLTQQIRQSIVADDSLSFTAKNVKIITLNGRVTLRGSVKTDAERNTIAIAARRIAGNAQVENYLEIAK